MILFYNKDDGKIFATIDGRVHGEKQLEYFIVGGNIDKKKIGKYIIGWIEKFDKEENKTNKIAYNLDKFKMLEEFESISKVSPLDYKIVDNKLIKKDD